MRVPDRVVFDAEPLVAFADGEPGDDDVAAYLDAVVRGDADGWLNAVNATEVRYILARKYDRETADAFLDWLWTIGTSRVDADGVWEEAAEFVLAHNPALGDAYALATALDVDGTLLVGGDAEYEDVTAVEVDRFRKHGV